ncbi:MAG: flavodoxin family protein [Spirochaetaceae bacterium]
MADANRTAVLFYSAYGNTRYIANGLARRLHAAVIEIEEEKPMKGLLGFIRGGFRAATTRPSPVVGKPWVEAKPYATLYLLTPIWAGQIAPAMHAVMQKLDFARKQVYVVTLQADPSGQGSRKVQDRMSRIIEKNGGSVEMAYTLHTAPPGSFAGAEQLDEELGKLL